MTAHAIYYLRCKCGASFEGWRGEQYFSEEQVRKAAEKKGWRHKAPDIDICPDCLENSHHAAKVEDYIKKHAVKGTWIEQVMLAKQYFDEQEKNMNDEVK